MHIGFICHEYPPCNHGGIGSFTKDLSEGLVKEGFQVSVIGIYTSNILNIDEPIVEEISGVHVYRFPEKKSYNKSQLNTLAERWNLYSYIKEIHKDKPFNLIESPESQGWLPMGLPLNIPLVTRFHGGESYFAVELGRKSSRLSKILEKSQIRHSRAIVSVSDHTAKVTLGLFGMKKPYTVIYNSVKVPDEFLDIDHQAVQKHCIAFTGSVIPKKGVSELVEAMNIIFERYPKAELYIAGKNNYKINGISFMDIMLNSIKREESKRRVKFLGAVERETVLFPLLASAEVCCFPSYSEAFALTPLESMAIGKAVVFTKLSSGPEAIEDGISGLLCDPSDPKDIAEKISFYFDNPKRADVIAETGRKRVSEHFGYKKWVKENIEYFTRLSKDSDES